MAEARMKILDASVWVQGLEVVGWELSLGTPAQQVRGLLDLVQVSPR